MNSPVQMHSPAPCPIAAAPCTPLLRGVPKGGVEGSLYFAPPKLPLPQLSLYQLLLNNACASASQPPFHPFKEPLLAVPLKNVSAPGYGEDTPTTTDTRAMTVAAVVFFSFGFLTCLNDVISPHLKSIFGLNYSQMQ